MSLYIGNIEPTNITVGSVPVSKVFVGDTQVRPSGGWQPGANTMIYLPLDGDVNDYSGNNRNGSISGSFTYLSIGNINVAQTGTTSSYINVPEYTVDMSVGATISIRYKFVTANANGGIFQMRYSSSGGIIRTQLNGNATQYSCSSDWAGNMYNIGTYVSGWHNFITVFGGGYLTAYIDGTYINRAGGSISGSQTASYSHQIGQGTGMSGSVAQYSNYIIENKPRTATEVQNYFNQTKSLYGL